MLLCSWTLFPRMHIFRSSDTVAYLDCTANCSGLMSKNCVHRLMPCLTCFLFRNDTKYLDSSRPGDYGRRAKHNQLALYLLIYKCSHRKACLQITRIITLQKGGIPASCNRRRVGRAKRLLISFYASQANESMYQDESQLPDNSTNKLIIETCILQPRQLQCALAHVHCMQQEAQGRRKFSQRARRPRLFWMVLAVAFHSSWLLLPPTLLWAVALGQSFKAPEEPEDDSKDPLRKSSIHIYSFFQSYFKKVSCLGHVDETLKEEYRGGSVGCNVRVYWYGYFLFIY